MERKLLTCIVCLTGLALATPALAPASQPGGSILYEDRRAVDLDLEFRAYVWDVRTPRYSKAVVQYSERRSSNWIDLDQNWSWNRQQALHEMVASARYIAIDGFLWRYQNPADPPDRARSYRFDERCYEPAAVTACARRLMNEAAR